MEKLKFPRRYILMPLVLMVFFFSFYLVYEDIKDRTISEFNNEQLILAKTASQGITSLFNDYQSNLTFLSQFKGIIDFSDESKKLMAAYYENHKSIITAITRVDADGVILYTYPYNQKVIGNNISYQKHVREVIATHRPVISDVFISAQGYLAIAMHVPIFKEKVYTGSLAILIPIDKVGKLYLEKMKVRGTGHVWLLSENGYELYCPITGHTGKPFLETNQNEATAVELIEKINKETTGIVKSIHTKSIINGKTRLNDMYIAFYRAPLGNTYWTVLISYQEREIYTTLAKLRNRLILIFSLLMLFIAYYFYSLIQVRNVLKVEAKRKKAEQTLLESEEKFRKIFEDHAAVKLLIDPDSGDIIDANKSAAHYYGWSREELKQMKITQINTLTEDKLNQGIEKVLTGKKFFFNFRHRLKDGSLRNVEVFSSKIKIGDKFLLHSIVHDVNDRKQVEEALRESENRFRKLVEQAPIAMSIVSMEGVIEFINQKAIDVFGYQPGDIPTMQVWWLKAYPQEDYRKVVESDWMGRVQKALSERTEIIGNEYQVTCKDGTRKTAFISGVPVSNKIFVLFDDITERKKVQEALRKSEERFRRLIETVPECVKVLTKDSILLHMNQAGLAMIDVDSLEQVVGKSVLGIVNPEYREVFVDFVQRIFRGESGIIDFKVTGLKGSKRWLESHAVPMSDEAGDIHSLLSVTRDITERKKAEIELIKAKEQAEESDRLKTAFLQNMSHEIRTPMNAIMGFSSLLVLNYNNKPKLEQFSEIINRRCNDLLEIINDILDISKIESGQLLVNHEECKLNELFNELSTFFKEHQNRIGKQQILLKLKADCEPSENVIITDKVKLRQIFINLIGNALKFTFTGKIEGGCRFDKNRNLVFYVSDTGIGIPPDKQDFIFERFTQLAQDKKFIYGGTGLGLAIVKGLVNLLGGKIWLESALEDLLAHKSGGTTFYFTFPVRIAQSIALEQDPIDESMEFQFPDKTILVVEDDPFNAEYIKEILSHTGVNILYAACGSEAVQLATSQSPDLVLMDIRLPDLDGYEVIHRIKQQKHSLKIIVQTAYAAYNDKQKAFDAGCNDYISKPLNRVLLLSMIHKHLSKK